MKYIQSHSKSGVQANLRDTSPPLFFWLCISGLILSLSIPCLGWADEEIDKLKTQLRMCEQQTNELRKNPESARLVGEFGTLTEFISKAHTWINQEEEDEGKRAVLLAQVQLQHVQELIIQRKTKAQFEELQEKANQLETQVKQERALVLKIEQSLGGVLGVAPTPPSK